MLVHAGFLPHSPLLIPNVEPRRQEELSATHKAIETLAHDLYATRPDTIMMISGHGERYTDAWSIDLADTYKTDLRPFGDLSEPSVYRPASRLVDALQRHLRHSDVPFTLSTNETLDYGTAVALRLLEPAVKGASIIPIAYCDREPKDQYHFGKVLRECVDAAHERIAVIATGDLSHCLASDAPGGYCAEGAVFDEAVQQAVRQGSLAQLLSIQPPVIEKARESGYAPLLILYGLLDTRLYESRLLSYEAPLGVGYLVAEFHP